jgi:hypothetical protein
MAKKKRGSKTTNVRDLAVRKGKDVKVKGGRSDIGAKLQMQLNEANNIMTRWRGASLESRDLTASEHRQAGFRCLCCDGHVSRYWRLTLAA